VVTVPIVPFVPVVVLVVVTTVPGVIHLDVLHGQVPVPGTVAATIGAVQVAATTAGHGAHVAAVACVTVVDVGGAANGALTDPQTPNAAPDDVEHARPGAHAGPLVAHLQYALPGVQSEVMQTPEVQLYVGSHVLLV